MVKNQSDTLQRDFSHKLIPCVRFLKVQNELAKLKHGPNEFDSLTVYGGVNIDDQTRALRRGVDFFVGTCGRVLDHIERGNIDFSALKTVILDEADQMLK